MSVELRPLRSDEFEEWFAGWSAWYAHDLEAHGGLRPDGPARRPSATWRARSRTASVTRQRPPRDSGRG